MLASQDFIFADLVLNCGMVRRMEAESCHIEGGFRVGEVLSGVPQGSILGLLPFLK